MVPTAHIETSHQMQTLVNIALCMGSKNERSTRSDITEQRIKDAIGYQLAKTKGWREVRHNPDIILSYDVLVERSSCLQSDPVYSWAVSEPSIIRMPEGFTMCIILQG